MSSSIEDVIRKVVREEIKRATPAIIEGIAVRVQALQPPPTSPIPLRLTVDEAAIVARRHPGTVSDALRAGELHGVQPSKNGRWRIRRDCLDAWIEGRLCQHQEAEKTARRRPKK